MRRLASVARLLLDQLDLVSVGILDERDDRRAMRHRAGLAHHVDAFGLQIRARLVRVRHADRQMTEAGAHVVALGIPVVGEFDDGVVVLITITDEGEGELAAWKVLLAQQLHPELIAVELQRLGEVVDANHCMQQLWHLGDPSFRWVYLFLCEVIADSNSPFIRSNAFSVGSIPTARIFSSSSRRSRPSNSSASCSCIRLMRTSSRMPSSRIRAANASSGYSLSKMSSGISRSRWSMLTRLSDNRARDVNCAMLYDSLIY